MRLISRALPASYVFEGMRTVVSGRVLPGNMLAVSNLLAIAYILLASWFFMHIYHQAVRTGLIARYSAESIS
jgi:ABC-2 type transport system permease protein